MANLEQREQLPQVHRVHGRMGSGTGHRAGAGRTAYIHDNLKRSGTPTPTDEYVTYREKELEFIAARGRRMAKWVMPHHPEIEVRQ